MRKNIKPGSPARIIEVVCKYLNVSEERLTGASRKRELVEGRHIAMAFIRYTNRNLSLKQIGKLFGDRDHSTVIYAVQTYEDLYSTDKSFRKKIDIIKSML